MTLHSSHSHSSGPRPGFEPRAVFAAPQSHSASASALSLFRAAAAHANPIPVTLWSRGGRVGRRMPLSTPSSPVLRWCKDGQHVD